jgi:hypothetical protein
VKVFLDNFTIKLLTQNWIDEKPDDGRDFCSHGKVFLKINNLILSNENSGDWSVASSALRLMKSSIYGFNSKNEFELIPCCGYLRLYPSCPRYITWDTELRQEDIIISNIQHSDNWDNGLKVINNSFKIPSFEYLSQVLSFANKVLEFYSECKPRKFHDKWEEEEFELFWNEFNDYYNVISMKCTE